MELNLKAFKACNFLSDERKIACFTVANKQKRNSLIDRSLSFCLPSSLDVISEQLSLRIKTTISKVKWKTDHVRIFNLKWDVIVLMIFRELLSNFFGTFLRWRRWTRKECFPLDIDISVNGNGFSFTYCYGHFLFLKGFLRRTLKDVRVCGRV